jgi:membrane protein required for colicin V production
MNWLDIVCVIIILTSIAAGFKQGLVKIGIGIAALVIGFFAASWTYGVAADYLNGWIHSRHLANIAGFLIVFCAVLITGSLIAAILGKMLRLVGLGWADRLAGAGIGAVRGFLFAVIVVMLLLAFTPGSVNAAVQHSRIAPYVVGASQVISEATPHEIREGVREGYGRVQDLWKDAVKHKKKKIAARED